MVDPGRLRVILSHDTILSADTLVSAQYAHNGKNQWGSVLLYGGLGFLIAVMSMWPVLNDMRVIWSSSDTYRHGWLVLPLMLYLAGIHHRESLCARQPEPSYISLGITVFAILLWLAGTLADIGLGKHIAFAVVLISIVLSTLGWRLFRYTIVLWLVALFMIPLGDLLQPPLVEITVFMIRVFSLVSSFPIVLEGHTIYVQGFRYTVIPACAGLNYVMLGAFVGYSIGALRSLALKPALLFCLLGAILGVVTNGIRVNTILWQDWFNGSQMELSAHGDIGQLILTLMLGALLLAGLRKNTGSGVPQTDTAPRLRASGHAPARLAPLLAGILVAAVLLPIQAFQIYAEEPRLGTPMTSLPPLDASALIPHQNSVNWNIDSQKELASITLELNSDLTVYLQQALGKNTKILPPSISSDDVPAWIKIATDTLTNCTPSSCVKFSHSIWTKFQDPQPRHTAYSYFVDDVLTSSTLEFRLRSGWKRVRGLEYRSGIIAFEWSADGQSADVLGHTAVTLLKPL